MKSFGAKQLYQNNFVIPNSDSDLKIEFTTQSRADWGGAKFDTVKINYKGHLLCEFVKEEFNPHSLSTNHEKAIELGVVSASEGDSFGYSAIIDGLYYIYNPVKTKDSSGRLYVKSFDALAQRLNNNAFYLTNMTQRLLQEAEQEALNKLELYEQPRGEPLSQFDSWEYLCRYINNTAVTSRASFCYVTLKLLGKSKLTSLQISGKTVWVNREIELEDYGYRFEDYRGRTYWLRENEILYQGRVYLQGTEFVECPCCGNQVPETEFDADEGECTDCASQAYEIHSYSTRVPQLLKFKAKKVKPDTLYMGCELEFETSDRDEARLKVGKALKGHAIMKSDGSINNGFEVVTCPATLDIQLEVFKSFFDKLPSELTNAPNVGMHVHVSRKPLSILSVGKMTEFMNREDNKRFIAYIAGREPNNYCRQDKRTVTFPVVYRNGGERYNTLNLSNKDTVEFRIFSTPLTYQDFASKLEFCQALVDFTKPCTSGLALKAQTHFGAFIDWVKQNHKFYPELSTKLKGFA